MHIWTVARFGESPWEKTRQPAGTHSSGHGLFEYQQVDLSLQPASIAMVPSIPAVFALLFLIENGRGNL
jgi:hypothetical protein